MRLKARLSCIISSFYIKPQRVPFCNILVHVVLYLHSTSNHNSVQFLNYVHLLYYIFILHQTTTQNVLNVFSSELYYIFILHQTTTLELGEDGKAKLYYIFILHQTTTCAPVIGINVQLYYIFILHQTTTHQQLI